MNKIFLLILMLPFFAFAQTKPKAKSTTKAKPKAKTVKVVKTPVVPYDGFIINGEITGYADGTVVGLYNGQTGAPESNTTIMGNKFQFKGKVAGTPDFKVIMFTGQPPYVTLFLDNSVVTVKGAKENLEKATVAGSTSHDDYIAFNKVVEPYAAVFAEDAPYNAAASNQVGIDLEAFVNTHKASYVSPIAVIRYNEATDNEKKMEELFESLAPQIKISPLGNYVANQIAEAKKMPVGFQFPDFAQADTLGKAITLSSLKGKYVLIDFWASWCGPCRKENPNVVAAYNRYKDKNFTIFGVSLDKDKQAWLNAIYADNLATWPHVSDLKGWQNAVAQQFGVGSIPQNFLLDPEGKLVGKNLRGAKLERKLAMLFSN